MFLILQSARSLINPAMVDTVKHLTQAKEVTKIAHNVFVIQQVVLSKNTYQRILKQCELAQIDCTLLETIQPLNSYKLLAMDMDSTLITIECIDEIADYCGKKDEVALITEATMRGEIKNFDESLTRRVALLAGLKANVLERVFEERLTLSSGAENLLAKAKESGLKTLLVSGGFTFFTERLKEKLALDYTRANQLEIIDGLLTGRVIGNIVNAQVKAETLQNTCNQLNISTKQVIAIGDGANDLEMLALAGMGVAYHAKPLVREQAKHAITFCALDSILNYFSNNLTLVQ